MPSKIVWFERIIIIKVEVIFSAASTTTQQQFCQISTYSPASNKSNTLLT
ncbi:Uncharacterised protein [Vibrio cholerae]|nr:Uncharacterised protein [Vibrio cholerae]CSC98776.1 Uncharacterised protein [Vibrio cholerae]